MPRIRQRAENAQITGLMIILVVVPVFLYPVFYSTSLFFDTFFGEQQVLHHVLEQSKRFVWDAFWGDWWAALPLSYGVVVPLLSVIYGADRRRGLSFAWFTPVVFVIAAVLVSLLLLQGLFMTPLLLTALLMAVPVSLSLWIIRP